MEVAISLMAKGVSLPAMLLLFKSWTPPGDLCYARSLSLTKS